MKNDGRLDGEPYTAQPMPPSGPSGRFYAYLMWKKAHEPRPKTVMLTPNLPIKVDDGQIWTPELPGTYKKILDLILAYNGDFLNYLPIVGSEVLCKHVGNLFTAFHAPALGLSVNQVQSLQRLEPCVCISSTNEIEITEDSWQACKELKDSFGWKRRHALFQFDFDGFEGVSEEIFIAELGLATGGQAGRA
ncbi:hypothetical protein QQS21_011564 [Conoideocrella luteorostrata]|uniref:Uncharacterized protein n=1 Tax=Conoideocrella luteorostrata TaxID=1105319 RepID=A0AAJ0CFM0_9HYPO|nr:hypothetical protein QQS21_011564 [Conoideocrella luteorostrata]